MEKLRKQTRKRVGVEMGRVTKPRKRDPYKMARALAKGFRMESWDSEDLPCGTKIARAWDRFGRPVGHHALDNAARFPLRWKITLIAKGFDAEGEPLTLETELIADQVKINDLEEVYVKERAEIKKELADNGCQLIDFGYTAVAA